jgi:hypothetical protein
MICLSIAVLSDKKSVSADSPIHYHPRTITDLIHSFSLSKGLKYWSISFFVKLARPLYTALKHASAGASHSEVKL